MSKQRKKPIVVITGASGGLGKVLTQALASKYTIVGTGLSPEAGQVQLDLTSPASIELAVDKVKNEYGSHVAAVIHLAGYYDFSGKESPLYQQVNEEGTRNLLDALKALKVDRFIYASTMLVHEAVEPGEYITEDSVLAPKWVYPASKAKTEAIIQQENHGIPYAILRLAGVYGDDFAVPTLSHQIARIYEKDLKSVLYAGNEKAGQSFLHIQDVVSLFQKVLDKRSSLPDDFVVLAGEPTVANYEKLQNTIGQLIHGESDWSTLNVPSPIAKAGAWLEEHAEPVVPDEFDRGEKPFIRSFMIDLASDHYALDLKTSQTALEWFPKRRILDTLPNMIENLKSDPIAWYHRNHVTPPDWMMVADNKEKNPQDLRDRYEHSYNEQHFGNIWAPFINAMLAIWLLFSPMTLGYQSQWMVWSDLSSGIALLLFATLSLSPSQCGRASRWVSAAIGLWLVSAPLIFWAPTPAAYLNGTLIGSLVMCFAIVVRPFPHASPVATLTGPTIPPGWDFSPSDWLQRLPIIVLAVFGLLISRYMAAYQLEGIDGVWDPMFAGAENNPKNGTEEIITSSVSKAWPVPDAGLGALTYLLEIVTGLIGSRSRWRTMPWLVLIFGFMIVPLGAISITFIIIQPIVLDTWCTLCLIAAAAMLLQIPYSFDEIVATIEFLRRKAKAGRPWLLILFTGDSDDGEKEHITRNEFRQPAKSIISEIFTGGVSFNFNLTVSLLVGVYLMFTRLILGTSGNLANADHLIGALVVTFTVTATAEVARPIRYVNLLLGLALIVTTFSLGGTLIQTLSSVVCGLLLIGLSFPKGEIKNAYGAWTRYLHV